MENIAINNDNSGSIDNNGDNLPTKQLEYDMPTDDRLMTILYRKIEHVEKKICELETKKIIDETQIPIELLDKSELLPSLPRKSKRGKGFRPILQSEIMSVKAKSPFARQQAKLLGVSFPTYKKYAKMYKVYEPKPNEKGKRNFYDPEKGIFPLSKILNNEFRNDKRVRDFLVKDKLIRSGTFEPKCNICGYDKRRIVDNKICLLLDHKDGDGRNFSLDNLQLLCLNCTYECGRGYIRGGLRLFDSDWLQGANRYEIDSKSRW